MLPTVISRLGVHKLLILQNTQLSADCWFTTTIIWCISVQQQLQVRTRLPHSYTSPGPTDTFTPASRPKSKGCRGLVFLLVIMLLQVSLITYHSNMVVKYANYRQTSFSALREQSTLEAERKKSEWEQERMMHNRELWKKVPEDHILPGAYWKPIWPANDCHTYGKWEYWGMLMDIPEGWSSMDACMNTPAEVQGVTIRRPDRCTFVNGFPHVHGYWMVDWDQENCKLWLKDFCDIVSPRSPHLQVMVTLIYVVGMYKLLVRSHSD